MIAAHSISCSQVVLLVEVRHFGGGGAGAHDNLAHDLADVGVVEGLADEGGTG